MGILHRTAQYSNMLPVQALVAENRLREALAQLSALLPTHLKNDVVLLTGQLTELERNERLGMTGLAEINQGYAKLRNAILLLANQLPVSSTNPKQYNPTEESLNPTGQRPAEGPARPKKVFISYSKSDKAHLEELRKHLMTFVRNGKIEIWDDTQLIPGEVWETRINAELHAADIVLFLVSANLINTDFVWNIEIPIAKKRRSEAGVHFIPIIVSDCFWSETDFALFNALPSKGKPISTFEDKNTAWTEVVKGIARLLS